MRLTHACTKVCASSSTPIVRRLAAEPIVNDGHSALIYSS